MKSAFSKLYVKTFIPNHIHDNYWQQARSQDFAQGGGGGGRRLERAPSRAFKGPLLELAKGPFQSNQGAL